MMTKVSPLGEGADALRDLVAAQMKARHDAIVEAQKQQQQGFENAIKVGDLQVRQSAATTAAQPKGKAPIEVKGVSDGQGGSVTRFLDPETFKVLSEVPEYRAPAAKKPPLMFRGVVGANGKKVTRLTDPETMQTQSEIPEFQDPKAPKEPSGYSTVTLRGPDGKDALFRVNPNSGAVEPMQTPQGYGPKPTAADTNAAAKTSGSMNSMIDDAYATVTDLIKDPNMSSAVGMWPGIIGGPIAGTKGYSYQKKFEKLLAQLTLPKLKQMMGGMGALSDREGARVEAAMTQAHLKQDEPSFKQALLEIQSALHSQIQRRDANAGLGMPMTPQPRPGAAPAGAPGRVYYDLNGDPIKR